METATSENTEARRLAWYSKCYKYLKNRNRISPGEVVIPNSEFFDTGPRRHLRIIRPPLQNTIYYENTNHERPQSVNDNFFSRWSKRPHPSGNCRCSFRRSERLSTTEEQFIANEIQQIRTSICEAEKNGQDLEEIERNVSRNLENLRANPQNTQNEEQITKEKIVKDLDKYINDLLDEILCNTIQILSEMDSSTASPRPEKTVKFSCCEKSDKAVQVYRREGYINAGFVGSEADPDTLDFHCATVDANVDYVDSGINSVETVELQQTEQPSLEQSLMEIIDSKLGKNTLDKSLEDLHMEIAEYGEKTSKEVADKVVEIKKSEFSSSSKDSRAEDKIQECSNLGNGSDAKDAELDDNVELKFDKTRLEFTDEEGATCTRNVAAKMNRTVSALRDKIATSLGAKKSQENKEKPSKPSRTEADTVKKPPERQKQNVEKPIAMRRNRKPMIVFLHGFGSSADIFENQLKYFSNLGYPCIAPEMLGHGFSSAPHKRKDYHFDKLHKDIDIIMNYYVLKPGQKCVLVGHNYGCSFATLLAAKYESQISQLILISGGGPTPLAPPSTEGIGHCFLRAMLAPFLMCGLHRDILYSARGRQHPYCGPGTQEQWPSHMKYVLKGMVWPHGDYAFHRRICTPTLLIHGLRDNSVSLVQECQMERTMIKALLEAIPTAGHIPMTDCPEQLNHMIHCFIDLWKNKR